MGVGEACTGWGCWEAARPSSPPPASESWLPPAAPPRPLAHSPHLVSLH